MENWFFYKEIYIFVLVLPYVLEKNVEDTCKNENTNHIIDLESIEDVYVIQLYYIGNMWIPFWSQT